MVVIRTTYSISPLTQTIRSVFHDIYLFIRWHLVQKNNNKLTWIHGGRYNVAHTLKDTLSGYILKNIFKVSSIFNENCSCWSKWTQWTSIVRIRAWCRMGNKAVPEPKMTQCIPTCLRHSVSVCLIWPHTAKFQEKHWENPRRFLE